MAEAPGHLLGQIIGNALEESLLPLLRDVSDAHHLYLDSKGPRPARPGTKLTWRDGLGNQHDLDFVLERGGSAHEIGTPAAFIESAWRRYTKHSRAKAQEIQGALLPLLTEHAGVKPFAGAVVAGNWTSGALTQMTSSGFSVLHIGYDEIVSAFAAAGVDVDADEGTTDAHLRRQVDRYQALTDAERRGIAQTLCDESSGKYRDFRRSLETALTRTVSDVHVLALSGERRAYPGPAAAIADTARHTASPEFVRYEVEIRFSNGDQVTAAFAERDDLVAFLRTFPGGDG